MDQMNQMNQMNQLNNPNNLDFDAMHVNYITPQYNNLKLNNYGFSTDQLTSGPQMNALSMKNNNIYVPPVNSMGAQSMGAQSMGAPSVRAPSVRAPSVSAPSVSAPSVSAAKSSKNDMTGGMSESDTKEEIKQSGGGKFIYKRYLKRVV